MADYKGFLYKGIASGLQSGVNMGMQLTQMKWQKKKQKELEDMTLKMNDTWNSIGQELISLTNDGQLSEDDKLKVYTLTMAAPYEMQGVMQNLRTSLSQFDTKGFDSQMELVKTFYEYAQGMDTNDIDSLYETFRGYITNPHALTLFEVADKKLRHEYEVAQAQPTAEVFATAEEVQEAYPGQGYKYDTAAKGYIPTYQKTTEPSAADKKYNWAIEHHALPEGSPGKISDEQLFKFMGVDVSDPEKRNTIQQRLDEMDKLGATTEEKKNYILGRTPEKPTPEGEITAGEKRTYDMASSIMFGSSDWVTGISKPGIISTMISNKLNMGQPLTDEEKTEVRNNYNAIKGTLPNEVISVVESQLQRYGIPLEAPVVTPETTPTPEPEPKKWWEFWKGETPTGTPTKTPPITPEVTPKAGEIPSMKVPTAEKEALIPLMTKKELEEAIKGLDPSDPLYKLIYDEAVKRGYITK